MAEIEVTFPNGQSRIVKFTAAYSQNVQKAMRRMGVTLEREIKRNLSGQSHTRFPGNSNPYPGVLTGRARASVNFQITGNADSIELKVGPNVVYMRRQEFGGTFPVSPAMRAALHYVGIHLKATTTTITTPARPSVWPAFINNEDKIMDDFQDTIFAPFTQ